MFFQSIGSHYRGADYIVNRTTEMNFLHNVAMETMGIRIRARRAELKMSQGKLAKECGLAQATISEFESGKYGGSRYVAKIANALKVNTLWLSDWIGPKEPGENNTPKDLVEEFAYVYGATTPLGREMLDMALRSAKAHMNEGGNKKQEQ